LFTNRFANLRLFKQRPRGAFARSPDATTFGVWPLTLPALANEPCTIAMLCIPVWFVLFLSFYGAHFIKNSNFFSTPAKGVMQERRLQGSISVSRSFVIKNRQS
jgi:hypothetical protein